MRVVKFLIPAAENALSNSVLRVVKSFRLVYNANLLPTTGPGLDRTCMYPSLYLYLHFHLHLYLTRALTVEGYTTTPLFYSLFFIHPKFSMLYGGK